MRPLPAHSGEASGGILTEPALRTREAIDFSRQLRNPMPACHAAHALCSQFDVYPRRRDIQRAKRTAAKDLRNDGAPFRTGATAANANNKVGAEYIIVRPKRYELRSCGRKSV